MKEQDSKRWSEKSKKKKKSPPPLSAIQPVQCGGDGEEQLQKNEDKYFLQAQWMALHLSARTDEQDSKGGRVDVAYGGGVLEGGFLGVDDSVRASGGSRAGRGKRRIYCDINEVVRLLVMEWLRFCARKTNTLKCSCC